MDPFVYVNFVFQTIFCASTLTAAIMMLKRNPRALVNRLFFLAYVCYSTVGLSIWIYNTFPFDDLIQSFVRITLGVSPFAVSFLFLGTREVFQPTAEDIKKILTIFMVISTALAIITVLWPNLVVTIDYDPVNNEIEPLPFLIILSWQIILVVRVIIIVARLYRIALKRLEAESKAEGKKPVVIVKMKYVIIGHVFGLLGIFTVIVGNQFGSPFGDTGFYILTTIDFVLTAYAVLKQEKVLKKP
ncbi:MAG: hypothetical protein ACFFCS_05710 [Candidatus Hodarchaeota archaeon]